MIGWTLGRYFFMRYAAIAFWFFTGVSILVFIIGFTELSGRAGSSSGYSVGWALSVAAMQVPMVMQQAVPFIALVCGMVTLISLNRKYELVVTRAAGISAWRFLAPVCAAAFVFGLLTSLVLNPLAAVGFERGHSMEMEVRSGGNRAQQGDSWLKQRTDEGETIIGAQSVLSQGLELVDATFIRFDQDRNLLERLDARRAVLRDGYWELTDVRRQGAEGATSTRVESATVPTNLAAEFVSERFARPEAIPIYDLPRKIDAARSFGLSANGFAMQFHSLVALPALLVAMTLIAATVSMRFARMGQSASIILGGILAGFLLYVITVLVKAFGTAGFVPPVAAAWFPVIVASFVGVTFLLHKEDG
jgi:lipopolysaccharide export system permease protein